MDKTVYKVGMWLEDKQCGDLYEITKEHPDIFTKWFTLSKRWAFGENKPYKNIFNTTCNIDSLDTNFKLAPAARILYSKTKDSSCGKTINILFKKR